MTKTSSKETVMKASLLITTLFMVVIFLFDYFTPKEHLWIKYLFGSVVIFFASFYVILNYFNEYIYSRVRRIYKDINKYTKEKKVMRQIEKSNDPIGTAKKEVNAWTQERIDEMKSLIEADNYRKEFIGNLAHELKTPIFSIQGYILTLLEGDALQDPKINTKFLQKAERGVERLVSLVEDLDSVAKIESGVFVPEMSKFNIVTLIQEVIESLEHAAVKHEIKLGYTGDSTEVIRVLADRKRIEQVLTNLVSNSISYGNHKGSTDIQVIQGKKKIKIQVKDNGIGINEENLKRVFERFYRVDKSRSRQHGGSGLGLAIVKHIIEAHDQSISVESKRGKGTTFVFTLKKVD